MRGITVILYEQRKTGVNALDEDLYEETRCEVENVLVGQPTEQEIIEALNLYGKKAVYILGIPKEDTHIWTAGEKVEFFGEVFRIIGKPIKGIDNLIPGPWNMKVRVESYE
ncbi:MAG: hypothetical protein MJ117_00325 [Lachnospiraceae bacterium]|nr:hypothetical protein [Lachnospiraceae bacterium]